MLQGLRARPRRRPADRVARSSSAIAIRRQKRNGERVPEAPARATARARRGRGVGRGRRRGRGRRPGSVVIVAGRVLASSSVTARCDHDQVGPAGRAGHVRHGRPDGLAAAFRSRRWTGGLRELLVDRPGRRPARACSTASSARTRRILGRWARRAGRQALPPGLQARADRALPVGGRRACTRLRPRSRASTTTSPSRARCCTTSGRSRRTRCEAGGAIELTDEGKLQGEIPLGYYMVRREIEDLPGFAPETAQAVLHIILSPPRAARARLPGGPVHARGDARAHDRQPRRPARLASTGSRSRWATARAGRHSTARSRARPTSRRARRSRLEALRRYFTIRNVALRARDRLPAASVALSVAR